MSNEVIQDPITARYRALLKISESSALDADLPAMFRSLAACLPGAVHCDALCVIFQQQDKVQILSKNTGSDIDILETTVANIPGPIDWKTQRPVFINSHSDWLRLLQSEYVKAGG